LSNHPVELKACNRQLVSFSQVPLVYPLDSDVQWQ